MKRGSILTVSTFFVLLLLVVSVLIIFNEPTTLEKEKKAWEKAKILKNQASSAGQTSGKTRNKEIPQKKDQVLNRIGEPEQITNSQSERVEPIEKKTTNSGQLPEDVVFSIDEESLRLQTFFNNDMTVRRYTNLGKKGFEFLDITAVPLDDVLEFASKDDVDKISVAINPVTIGENEQLEVKGPALISFALPGKTSRTDAVVTVVEEYLKKKKIKGVIAAHVPTGLLSESFPHQEIILYAKASMPDSKFLFTTPWIKANGCADDEKEKGWKYFAISTKSADQKKGQILQINIDKLLTNKENLRLLMSKTECQIEIKGLNYGFRNEKQELKLPPLLFQRNTLANTFTDKNKRPKKYVITYGSISNSENKNEKTTTKHEPTIAGLNAFDLQIIDNLRQKDWEKLRGKLTRPICYLSLGEINNQVVYTENTKTPSEQEQLNDIRSLEKHDEKKMSKKGRKDLCFIYQEDVLEDSESARKFTFFDGLGRAIHAQIGTKIITSDEQLKAAVREKKLTFSAFYINPSCSEWHKIIEKKSEILVNKDGCNGLFFDTVDTAKDVFPRKFTREMVDGMASLIISLRDKFPTKFLIQNGGLFGVGYDGAGNSIAKTSWLGGAFDSAHTLSSKTFPYVDAVMFENYKHENMLQRVKIFNDMGILVLALVYRDLDTKWKSSVRNAAPFGLPYAAPDVDLTTITPESEMAAAVLRTSG